MAKDTFYFSHDYNTRSDEKIKQLVRKHGMSGYGAWWSIVEDLYNNANALRTDYDGIAYDLRLDIGIVKSILHDFDLFCFDGEFFGSSSIEKRIIERNSKSEKARESAVKRWEKQKKDANALPSQTECNAIKESKVKENKVFIPPSEEEVIDYFHENGYLSNAAVKAYRYYSPDWVDSKGKKVLNWKQKMVGVWFKDENRITPPKPFSLVGDKFVN